MGTRTRPQKMHDGLSLTFEDAIMRHRGEASEVTEQFLFLSPTQRKLLLTFLGLL